MNSHTLAKRYVDYESQYSDITMLNVIQFKPETKRELSIRTCLEVALRTAFNSMTDAQLSNLVKEPVTIEAPLAKA